MLLLPLIFALCSCLEDITKYGAVKHSDTLQAQQLNQAAINKAVLKANASSSLAESSDRWVLIPKGTFYSMPVWFNGLVNVTLVVEGRWAASKLIKDWPQRSPSTAYYDFFSCQDCHGITIRGGGHIDGRGYNWWVLELLAKLKGSRPHLLHFSVSTQVTIHDVILRNSPNFHVKLDDCQTIRIHHVNIRVNTTAQLNLLTSLSLEGLFWMFPFNTDGIDPRGNDIHIYNVTCQNWDDVVVAKPSRRTDRYGTCTQDMLVENITVRLGVGMTIGTVPPNDNINCVRDVLFRNVEMERPFKGIYLKTNPGDNGYGIIDNITYVNVSMFKPIWWAVYLGPQQQKQPDGGGPGCMLYPFDPKGKCSTQPRVNITNIRLENITIIDSLLDPILIRCNSTNPCKNIQLRNITAKKWRLGKHGYICENAEVITENVTPNVTCKVVSEATPASQGFYSTREGRLNLRLARLWSELIKADYEVSSKYPSPESGEFDDLESVMNGLMSA